LKIRKWIKLALIVVLCVSFIFSFIKVIIYYVEGTVMEQRDQDIKQMVNMEIDYSFLNGVNDEENYSKAENVYNNLQMINEDSIGWISIPETGIDYPVVQTEDNVYYLSHNIENELSSRGCIFMDCQNVESDLHIVLYGHNMVDGSMFSDLELYEEVEYYQNHSIIEFNMYGEQTSWEIFSVMITDSKPYRIGFIDDADYFVYVNEMKQNSIYEIEVDITEKDRVLTLSTCTSWSSDERFVIHAKLIDK
jgi:sortase B